MMARLRRTEREQHAREAGGRLKAPIDLEAPWEQIAQVAAKLHRDRAIAGKAVLTL
jgi:hypothetical protein